jgi:hypothetical protein
LGTADRAIAGKLAHIRFRPGVVAKLVRDGPPAFHKPDEGSGVATAPPWRLSISDSACASGRPTASPWRDRSTMPRCRTILIAPKLQTGMHLAHPVQRGGSASSADFFRSCNSRTNRWSGQAATHQPHPVQRLGVMTGRATGRVLGWLFTSTV